jgi:hypothetical protein
MRNISDRLCRENQNTLFMISDLFFLNRAFHEMWKNISGPDMPQMTLWLMRTTRWITKRTETLSLLAILITCPLQQWLHKRASISRYVNLRLIYS